MLAMFLQSSKKKKRHLDGPPQVISLCAHTCSSMGGGGEQGQTRALGSNPGGPVPWWQHLQPQVGVGDAGPAGSLVSVLLSPIIHAGNWPACPAPAPAVMYGRRRSKKKAE